MRRSAGARVWLLLAVGLVTLGSSAILIRLAGDVPPLSVAAWRTLLVASAVLPAVLLRRRAAVRQIGRAGWLAIGAAGVLLGFHFAGWIASVQLTTVAAASVLVTTSPLFIVALEWLAFRRRPTARTLLAVAVGIAGAACIGWASDAGPTAPSPALGGAMAVGAAACIAVYLVVGGVARRETGALVYFALVTAVAAGTTTLLALAAGSPLVPPPGVVPWVVAMALGPGLLGHGAFVVALRHVSPTTVGVLALSEPIVASLVAALLFDEVPNALALGGMVAVLASIGLVVAQPVREGSA